MALDPRYIVSINLQEYLVDKDTGLPLAGGYIAFFKDRARNQAKIVYELTGSPPNYTYSPLPNPVRVGVNGVPTNNSDEQVHIYYYPYDAQGNIELYFVEVFNNLGVSQYSLEGWPNITAQDDPQNFNNNVDNQISNGQFSQVLFIPGKGMTISFDSIITNQSYQIAPGWEVIISSTGSGSVEIQQVSLEGSLNVPTNAPYYISFQPSGNRISSLVLRQTLNNNPDIWSTTTDAPGYVSGFMMINSLDGQSHTIEMQYAQSGGPSSPQTIVSGSTGVSGYVVLDNVVLLNAGTNTDNSNVGSIYIDIVLPNIGFYGITSIQVAGVDDDISTIPYQQETVNRQIDHLSHYYKSGWDFKPIKSYLCAWDFPLNPAQPRGDTVTLGAVTSDYVWDQTIIYQSSLSSVSISRSLSGKSTGSLKLDLINNCQLAVIQYLTVPQIYDLLTNELSSNIIIGSTQGDLEGCISLWYTTETTVPDINTDHSSLVALLNAEGKPTSFNGVWTEVTRSSLGDALFTLSSSQDLNNLQSFGFNGWGIDPETDIHAITYFAIVIGFSEIPATKSVVIQSCSLVPGSIATPPAPQTYAEVLQDSRYYYWMTYDPGTVPGTATIVGVQEFPLSTYWVEDITQSLAYPTMFTIEYGDKVILPQVVTFYSYLNANITDAFVGLIYGGSATQKTFSASYNLHTMSKNRISYEQNTTNAVVSLSPGITYAATAFQSFHVTIDSRIGIYTP